MAICIELPEEVQKYNAKITSISIGDQREGELLLSVEQDRECPTDIKKLFDAVAGGMEIDGRKVNVEHLNRVDDDKTLIYIDWSKEGNQSQIAPELDLESWDAVADGLHNSNSHLIFWRDEFWLIHANSPYHFATPECKLILWRSKDAKNWTQVTTFSIPDEDIRDPKFAVIHDKLFIYVLKSFVADSSEPYTTAYTYTEDGEHFAPLTDLLKNHGWLFMGASGFFFSGAQTLPWAIVPDSLEYDEYKTGHRHEGVFYALMATIRGAMAIRLIYTLVPILLFAATIILTRIYPLPKERFEQIKAELEKRKEVQDRSSGG